LRIDFIGGQCPVQAEGTVDGRAFSFRARHRHWSFALSEDPANSFPDDETADFFVEEQYGDTPDAAGYMLPETAEALIRRCADEYRRSGPRPPCRHGIRTSTAVVRQGKWLYAGEVPCSLRILNCCEEYEKAGQDCRAPVHRDLEQYFVVEYGSPVRPQDYSSRSENCGSLEEAVRKAAEATGNTVEWD
jgi:hypothetical protein